MPKLRPYNGEDVGTIVASVANRPRSRSIAQNNPNNGSPSASNAVGGHGRRMSSSNNSMHARSGSIATGNDRRSFGACRKARCRPSWATLLLLYRLRQLVDERRPLQTARLAKETAKEELSIGKMLLRQARDALEQEMGRQEVPSALRSAQRRA